MIKNYVKNIKTMIYYKSSVGDKNELLRVVDKLGNDTNEI